MMLAIDQTNPSSPPSPPLAERSLAQQASPASTPSHVALMMETVLRKSILDRIRARGDVRLLMIEGPSGSGKSTLLRQIGALPRSRDGAVVFIDLPEGADVSMLEQGLLDALGTDGSRGAATGLEDAAETAQRLEQAARMLRKPVHILIDDFQRVHSPAATTLLTRLLYLEPAPPITMTIASRIVTGLPVTALRLRGELAEVGSEALEFSPSEAEALRRAAGAPVPPGPWAEFVRKVNGWAVALQLALVLLRERRIDVPGLLSFSGQQREMAAYLSQLILAGLSDSDRKLVLAAAGFERLRRDVREAVLGKEQARRLRELLVRLALPLDGDRDRPDEQRLHSLVSGFLEAEAANAGIDLAAIRQRVAEYLADHGEWRRAVSQALRSGSLAAAAAIAERGGGWRLVYRGEDGMAQQFLELARLTPAEGRSFPRTLLGLAISAAKRGEIDVSLGLMERADEVVHGATGELQAEYRLVEALLDLYSDRVTPPDRVAQLEADIAPKADADPVRLALTQNLLCFLSLRAARFEAAIRYGGLSSAAFRAAGSDFGAAHLPLHVGQAEFLSGQVENSRATLSQHVARCLTELGPDADLTLMAQVFLAEVDLESGRDDGLTDTLDHAIDRLGMRDSWFDPLASAVISRQRLALLHDEDVHAVLRRVEAIAERRNYARLLRLVGLLRIEALVRRGQLAEAESLMAGLPERADSSPEGDPVNLRGLPLGVLRARLRVACGDAPGALALLEAPLAQARAQGNVPRLVRLVVIGLQALRSGGQTDTAWSRLQSLALERHIDRICLPFAEEGPGFGAFLQEHLLTLDPDSLAHRRLAPAAALVARLHPGAGPAMDARLTGSENDVLLLLERGLPNKQIARTLGISSNTVKFHLANLYRKLGASGRTAALARARDAGLLGRARLTRDAVTDPSRPTPRQPYPSG